MFGIPFLTPGLLIKGGCILAIVGAISFGGWEVVHTISTGAVKSYVAADAVTTAKAQAAGAQLDSAQATIDTTSAETSAAHQTREATAAATVKAKVTSHVHNPAPTAPRVVGCVTYGLVRLHDAAALGVDPDTLSLPSGVTDDACSPVADTDLAAAFADNYAAARANAAQLNDLIANVTAKVDATTPKE